MVTFLKKKGAFSGVKLAENKITSGYKIEKMPPPAQAIIPLHQNLGAPCTSIIQRGDLVLKGQKIGDSDGFISAPVHSSISGKVSSLGKIISPATGAFIEAIFIANDMQDNWVEGVIDRDPINELNEIIQELNNKEKKDFLAIIKEAGIVGLGGASFPTHVKLNPPKDKKIEYLLINGCECEPYITSDEMIMIDYTHKFLLGVYIMELLLRPKEVCIAIEDNKEAAIDKLKSLVSELDFAKDYKIVSVQSKYPMGSEKTLIKTLYNREVPEKGLPADVGCVVHNVATAKAVYDAVVENKPLIEKVLTVTGEVGNPKNVSAMIGTPISEVLNYCGKLKDTANKVIIGGPMMGQAIYETSFPIVKAANCILALKSDSSIEQNCIRCAKCVSVCPMNLMPLMYVRYVKVKKYDTTASDYFINSCIECGCCSYVCPSSIPIVGYIKTGKSMLKKG